jgi:hypothetical protein
MTPRINTECRIEYFSDYLRLVLKTIQGTVKTNNIIAFLNGESDSIIFEVPREYIETISEIQKDKFEIIYDTETQIAEPLEYIKEEKASSMV